MGRRAWRNKPKGPCAMCGRRGSRVRHHVVYEQHVKLLGGDIYDLRNSMLLGMSCTCHGDHHSGMARIPIQKLTAKNWAFAVELFESAAKAEAYFERYYARSVNTRRLRRRASQSEDVLAPDVLHRYRRREGARE